jgi:probable HAF family extracellular repeat protein
MTDLGTLATGSTSKGIGLNNTGQVVGYAAASGTNHAFLWQNDVMTDLVPGFATSTYGTAASQTL